MTVDEFLADFFKEMLLMIPEYQLHAYRAAYQAGYDHRKEEDESQSN